MFGDIKFADLIRIHQIRSKPRKSTLQQRNRNFEEFADVYKEIVSDSFPNSSKLKPGQGSILKTKDVEIYPKRPLHDVKKIHLEMPFLGAECAIVTAPKKPQRKPLRKKVEKLDKSLLTEAQITKWNEKKTVKPITPLKGSELPKDTQLLLKQTKQDIDESTVQLEALKTIINQIKPPEKIKKSRTTTYKSRRKSERHADCISKKYITTLNTMQQKLQTLEEKYFSQPHVVYKNVRDICTTFSNVDLYQQNSSIENINIDETLEGIKQELDSIVNTSLEKEEKKSPKKSVTFKAPEVEFNTVGDTYDEEKSIDPMNFSFKKSVDSDDDLSREEQVNYSKIIDQSECWFKKFLKVDKFCQEICNIEDDTIVEVSEEAPMEIHKEEESDRSVTTDESDKESHDSSVDKFYLGDNLILLKKELQAAITNSSYLSKEFDKTKLNVKVFPNTDNYIRRNCFGAEKKTPSSVEPSITDLIENLSLSLQGSIYYKSV